MDATGGAVAGDRPDPGDVMVALHLLERMRLTPDDLVGAVAARRIPTFAELVPKALEAMSVGTRRTYSTYVNKVMEAWGPRRLDEVDAGEARAVTHRRGIPRRSATHGTCGASGA
ncbi:hypothetical protein ALI22I_13445 [Saccharothrix sp. ALI-22-I]|nr:hypothetical protein ALI22I_13445 [Saccharothrix sp. ALI-22-I]